MWNGYTGVWLKLGGRGVQDGRIQKEVGRGTGEAEGGGYGYRRRGMIQEEREIQKAEGMETEWGGGDTGGI